MKKPILPYDVDSVMQYPSDMFAYFGTNTMTKKDGMIITKHEVTRKRVDVTGGEVREIRK